MPSVIPGNCKEELKKFDDNFFDSIVTDPPYELGFMGKKWDNSGISYDVGLWKECLRVLKPGGHLLRFEIRDCIDGTPHSSPRTSRFVWQGNP